MPTLAAVFGPDVVVSQHGADTHAWDPLANLRVTTTAMAAAARVVDAVAHRWAGGRWLATGGGGYDAYRVVPRAWALTWLAGAHREPPERTRRRGAIAGPRRPPGSARRGCRQRSSTSPTRDVAGSPRGRARSDRSRRWPGSGPLRCPGWCARPRTAAGGRRRWRGRGRSWSQGSRRGMRDGGRRPGGVGSRRGPRCAHRGGADLDGLGLAQRVVAPFDPGDAAALLRAAALDGARLVAAVSGSTIVGIAVPPRPRPSRPWSRSWPSASHRPSGARAGWCAAPGACRRTTATDADGGARRRGGARRGRSGRTSSAPRDRPPPARRGRLRGPRDTSGPRPRRSVDAGREAAGRLTGGVPEARGRMGRDRRRGRGPSAPRRPRSTVATARAPGRNHRGHPSAPTSIAWNPPPPTARSARYHERRAREPAVRLSGRRADG